MVDLAVDRIDLDSRHWPVGDEVDQEAIDRLVETLRHGAADLLNPILVRAAPGRADRYDLIAGRVRLSAARATGRATIPCRIIEADDVECAAIQIIEQGCRRDWPDLELGWLLAQLQDRVRAQGERCEVRDLVARVGLKKSTISGCVNLARAIPLSVVEAVATASHVPPQCISRLRRDLLREIRRPVTLEHRTALLQAAADAIAAGTDVEASVNAAAREANPPFRLLMHPAGFYARVNLNGLSAAERSEVTVFLQDALAMLGAENPHEGENQIVKRFPALESFAAFARRTWRTWRASWNRVLRRANTAGTL